MPHPLDEEVRLQVETVRNYLQQYFQHVEDAVEIQGNALEDFHAVRVDTGGNHVVVEVSYGWLRGTPVLQIRMELDALKVVEHLKRPTMAKVRIRPTSLELIPG